MSESLLLMGACVRPAAFSALRAGFAPLACDLFGDVDLRAVCRVIVAARYPSGFVRVAERLPPTAWMFTGGLENYPRIVERIARRHELLGNPAPVLRRVRCPFRAAEVLEAAGVRCPARTDDPAAVPTDGTWVRKVIRSSGGGEVTLWHEPVPPLVPGCRYYFQQWVGGMACSAIYVAAGGDARFVGASEQLIRAPWTAAEGFRYAGSLGPLPLSSRQRTQFEQIGRALASGFGLQGFFGVDAVMQDDIVWPIEINPRYTASIEVLERASGVPLLKWHVQACREGTLPQETLDVAKGWSGKAIMYARRNLVVDETIARYLRASLSEQGGPAFADVPAEGTAIRAGLPITTLLADAPDRAALEAELRSRASGLEELLYAARVNSG